MRPRLRRDGACFCGIPNDGVEYDASETVIEMDGPDALFRGFGERESREGFFVEGIPSRAEVVSLPFESDKLQVSEGFVEFVCKDFVWVSYIEIFAFYHDHVSCILSIEMSQDSLKLLMLPKSDV